MPGALEVVSLYATLSLNDTMTRGLRQAGREAESFGQRMQRTGRNISAFGAGMSQALSPVTDFLTSGINVAGDFESAMNEVAARTGLAGDEIATVRDLALQMGSDTAFSAQQAADAMLQLLSSGQSVEDAMATLPAVLSGAAAGGMDLALAADAVTDIMAMFGLEVEDLPADVKLAADAMGLTREQMEAWADGRAPEVAPMMDDLARATGRTTDELREMIKQEDAADVVDSLVRAAGASSASMQELYEGLVNVGTSANLFGMNSKDTITALAVLAENGIKGAEAGTKLNSMLTQMSSTAAQGAWDELGLSMYDAAGNVKDFDTIIGELDAAFADLTMEDQIRLAQALGGAYGKGALLALLNADGIGAMTEAMDKSASVAEVADARMAGWEGANEALQGSIETLQIQALTPLLENVLTPIVQELTNVVNSVTEWVEANPELATTLMTVLDGGVLLLGVMVPLGIAVSAAGTAFTALTTAAGLIGGVMMGAMGPILLVGAAIAGVIAQIHEFNRLTGGSAMAAGQAYAESGATRQQLEDAAFNALAAEFGGPGREMIGDIMARLFYSNVADTVQGQAEQFYTPIPGHASGGKVSAGSPYIVGEEGPELFVSGSSGYIVPNHELGGGVVVNLTTIGTGERDVADFLLRALRDRGL